MVSPVNKLNFLFHYKAAVEMEGFQNNDNSEYNFDSRRDFVTGIHDDDRSQSLEKYAEIYPTAEVLESASAAIVYNLEFDGQETEVRLEYNEESECIGVDMEDNGKRSKFARQLSAALEEETKVKTESIAPQL